MKSIFITGAATGIGRQIARRFHSQGWFVGLFDIDKAGVDTLAKELGDNTFCGELDVTDVETWNRQLEAFYKDSGQRLDVLVNNAGILFSGFFDSIPIEHHQAIMNVNVGGVMNGCYSALPWLRKTKNSCVVNIASASAIYGSPSLASYSASKFAVRGLTEALNLEWESYDIRVLDIWPLFVKTNMVEGMDASSIKKMGVNLTSDDVAKTVEKAVTAGADNRKIHWPVGFMESIFKLSVDLLPAGLCRLFVKKTSM